MQKNKNATCICFFLSEYRESRPDQLDCNMQMSLSAHGNKACLPIRHKICCPIKDCVVISMLAIRQLHYKAWFCLVPWHALKWSSTKRTILVKVQFPHDLHVQITMFAWLSYLKIERNFNFNFNFKQFISPRKWQWLQNVNKLQGGGPCLGPLRLLQFKLIFCWFACDRPALVGPRIIVAQLK